MSQDLVEKNGMIRLKGGDVKGTLWRVNILLHIEIGNREAPEMTR